MQRLNYSFFLSTHAWIHSSISGHGRSVGRDAQIFLSLANSSIPDGRDGWGDAFPPLSSWSDMSKTRHLTGVQGERHSIQRHWDPESLCFASTYELEHVDVPNHKCSASITILIQKYPCIGAHQSSNVPFILISTECKSPAFQVFFPNWILHFYGLQPSSWV